MCECNSYEHGHCAYFDVEVGELTYGCTRGKMVVQHQGAFNIQKDSTYGLKPHTGNEQRELSL